MVNDRPVTKPGQAIDIDAEIRVRGELPKYVSRGGDKLEGALRHFVPEIAGLVALDLGASTGGFTDCLLQHGVSKVYAVDVGTAQLAEKLRKDNRVKVIEQFHAKDLTAEMFEPRPQFAVIDVSFIGLKKVLPYAANVLRKPWSILGLVKPQFELEPEAVAKGGIIEKESDQLRAVESVLAFGAEQNWQSKGYSKSELKGAKSGNQEYFVFFESR